MRLTDKTVRARKYLLRPSSSLGQSQKMHLCWTMLFWAAHLHLERESWSTLGLEICPTKVREPVTVRSVEQSILPSQFINTVTFISDPSGKFVSTVTEFGCIPITTMFHTEQFGWMVTRLVYTNINTVKTLL